MRERAAWRVRPSRRPAEANFRRGLLAPILVAAGALGACARPSELRRSEAPDLWLVTLDTFRADRTGCMGHPGGLTPALDRIARRGLLARDAFTPAPLTAVAHATILTAQEPPTHGVRENGSFVLPEELSTLAEHLGPRGFATGAFIAALPLENRFGFGQGFDRFDEELPASRGSLEHYAERPADAVVDSAIAWVRGLQAPQRFFLWTHFFDPHHPRRIERPWNKLPAREDYDREIRFTDFELGRLERELDAHRTTPRVTAVVSDHGEALGDHGESSHGVLVHEETMRAFLAIALPEGFGGAHALRGIELRVIRLCDLAPTLLDVLGVEALPNADGRSLMAAQIRGGAYGETYYPMIHYGWSPLFSWRDARWTYIEGPEPELYDRTSDPGELVNRITEKPDVAAELSQRLASWIEDPAPENARSTPSETREQLLALGYVSAEAAWPVDRKKNPKKLIGAANALFRGISLLGEANSAAALPFLQHAYRLDPENTTVLFYLANALRLSGDPSSAMSYYRRAIQANPRAGDAYAHLAVLEFEGGRREEAFRVLDEGFEHNADSFSLLMASGDLHRGIASLEKADSLYRAASELEPRRVEAWVRLAELREEVGDEARARELWKKVLSIDAENAMIPPHVRDAAGANE
jgi:arylsulfatase A-like enzyme/Flp pilus assembly protein TadD